MRKLALIAATLSLTAQAQAPMPPNTVQLSAMMEQLSSRPGFTEAFLHEIEGNKGHKQGAALLTPALVDDLRKTILGRDWQRLDRFPGWTMGQINPTVRVIGHYAGRDSKLDSTATAGGAPSGQPSAAVQSVPAASGKILAEYLDVGPYPMPVPGPVVSLDDPAAPNPFVPSQFISSLGDGVTRGDGPGPLAASHAASTRLSQVLNRLSMNGYPGVATFTATLGGQTLTTPQALIQTLQATGHTVTVTDSRYFANFGHLHFKGQDVMMPFYVDPLIRVPGTDRPLLVPVSHAEYEWHVRGLEINADVSFYFGIDGHAEWRTMDQLDQAWVMKRDAHTYTGSDAVEVTRLNGLIVPAWQRLHQAHPEIPFGGYYAFGVCQDVVAAVELKLTGRATLFPNTADPAFFTNPQDAEINGLIRRLPKDRGGRPPQVDRIFGSLPVGSSDAELATIPIPGLAPDLIAVHDAWTRGNLQRIRPTHHLRDAFIGLGAVLLAGVLYWIKRRRGV